MRPPEKQKGEYSPVSAFVLTPDFDPGRFTRTGTGDENDWPATYLAIFDVLLSFDGIIDQHANDFSAVGTADTGFR